MAQPKSQLPLYLGIAAAGGVGYYLYTAGGSPKVAEKQFESTSPKGTTSNNYQIKLTRGNRRHLASLVEDQVGGPRPIVRSQEGRREMGN